LAPVAWARALREAKPVLATDAQSAALAPSTTRRLKLALFEVLVSAIVILQYLALAMNYKTRSKD
jgi:hypothetical protein